MTALLRFLSVFALLLLPWPTAWAQEETRPELDHYNLSRGLAIDGYDPVAYFPEFGGAPTKGSKKITLAHRGVTYRFQSEAHRTAFRENPTRFEPAYGGWCAYAMAREDKTDIDPKYFLIQDGRLLLFYKGFLGGDTRAKWSKGDTADQGKRADAYWQSLTNERAPYADRDGLEHYNLDGGLALGGFDPVAYFSETGAARGSEKHTAVFGGITYRFASDANREAFLAEPARYEPQFGGWSVAGMQAGEKSAVDGSQFLVLDGKLLLFASAEEREGFPTEGGEAQLAAARKAWGAILAP